MFLAKAKFTILSHVDHNDLQTRRQSILQRTMKTSSFKEIGAKIKIKNIVSVRLTSQTILIGLNRSWDLFVFRKCVSVRLFTVKTLLFPEIYTFELVLH